jgi:hypothetical protein
VPTEVIATPRAGQQIARLDRTHAKAFGEFLDDLAARGCNALGYRLSGPAPVDHMCVKHLRDSLRVVVAFEEPDRAWILLVGRHDDQDPVLSVYAELYRLLGVEPPDSAGRDKPPCCDETTDLPPVLGAAVAEFAERAAKVRRTRRRPASLRICDAAVEQGYGQELALFTTRCWLAPQGREVVSHTSTAVSRSVTGLCEVDVPYPPIRGYPPKADQDKRTSRTGNSARPRVGVDGDRCVRQAALKLCPTRSHLVRGLRAGGPALLAGARVPAWSLALAATPPAGTRR